MKHINKDQANELIKKMTSIIHNNTRSSDLQEIKTEKCQKALSVFLETELNKLGYSVVKSLKNEKTLSDFLIIKDVASSTEAYWIQEFFMRGGLDAVQKYCNDVKEDYFDKIKEHILEYMNVKELVKFAKK